MTETPSTDSEPAINPTGFRSSPAGHVYGIVDDPERDVPAVTAGLLTSRIPHDGIHVYCCSEGVEALDPRGKGHGLRARINRLLQSVGYEDGHRKMIEAELESGHALIGVKVDDSHKGDVAAVLRGQGGHDIVYYGKHTWQRLSPPNG